MTAHSHLLTFGHRSTVCEVGLP